MLREVRTFRGHTKDVLCAAWHPVHEELFASGGYDGSLLYWLASRPGPQVPALTALQSFDYGIHCGQAVRRRLIC